LSAQDNVRFELPRDDEHTTIVGRNGTGKTQAGAWLLSEQSLQTKPWVILDYKGEEMLNSIPRIREIGFNEAPSQPGLYILKSRPDLDVDTENWLWRIWEKENTGVFIDEGYMLPEVRKGAFSALLTQGRSKRTPVITLSQRPVRVDRAAFSEASHLIAFDLNDKRDHKSLEEVVPTGFMKDAVPKYHARWYSVKKDKTWIMKPVPEADQIVDTINEKLPPLKRWF
jgi:Type IV secretion-system coupling protein DNA-binding domain